MTTPPIAFDLNEGLSKALIDKFFEPTTIAVAVDPQTGMILHNTTESPVAVLAGAMFERHARAIMDEVWTRIDKDQLADLVASKVANSVVDAYTKRPDYWSSVTPEQKTLHLRILEIVAQTLGQRVVDQMDLQLSSKPALEQGQS